MASDSSTNSFRMTSFFDAWSLDQHHTLNTCEPFLSQGKFVPLHLLFTLTEGDCHAKKVFGFVTADANRRRELQ